MKKNWNNLNNFVVKRYPLGLRGTKGGKELVAAPSLRIAKSRYAFQRGISESQVVKKKYPWG